MSGSAAVELRPQKIHLEAMGACQLKCPACPTADGSIRPTIAPGYLRFETFKKLVDENPWVKHIELSNYGEIFLNPQLVPIVEYAAQKGVKLTADNGVNLNTVKEDALEAVVKYGFRAMTCSIDGASQETYSIYRVKGDFDTVIANIRKINEYKKKYNTRYPILTWQFIVFGHNEHELPKAQAMCDELGMYFKPKLNWDSSYSPIKDREFVQIQIGKSGTREEFQEDTGLEYSRTICHQLWQEPQINLDGKLLGCCRNFWGDFGANVFESGLAQALNNPKITYARQMLMGQVKARGDIPCTTCDVYKSMRSAGKFITLSEMRRRSVFHRLAAIAKTNRNLYRVARFVYRATGARNVMHWYVGVERHKKNGHAANGSANGSATSESKKDGKPVGK